MAINRRKFITQAGLIAGGTIVAPYILPSGRLFAQTGDQKAKHVIFVVFGGGIRQQESILQQYIQQSQPQADGKCEGNIMYNMFEGAPPPQKIVYGTKGILPGDTPIPKLLPETIQKMGTTFREVRATGGGHYGSLAATFQGRSDMTQGLRSKPMYPTIFEYVRKHMGAPASKVWFIGEDIKNSVPLLNYGVHPDYGIEYGANMFVPKYTFMAPGKDSFTGGEIYHPEEEMKYIYKMKFFLDNYYRNLGGKLGSLKNMNDEIFQIKTFMKNLYLNSGGQNTVDCTLSVCREFKPTLIAVNFNAGVDICHFNFTSYLRGIHAGDNAVARLWQGIQAIPEMAGNTAMVLVPDMGRNLTASAAIDENNFRAFDHSDANTNRIFAQMVGAGIPANVQIGDANNPVGQGIDCMMTIADLLGIKGDVQAKGLAPGSVSLLDQM